MNEETNNFNGYLSEINDHSSVLLKEDFPAKDTSMGINEESKGSGDKGLQEEVAEESKENEAVAGDNVATESPSYSPMKKKSKHASLAAWITMNSKPTNEASKQPADKKKADPPAVSYISTPNPSSEKKPLQIPPQQQKPMPKTPIPSPNLFSNQACTSLPALKP